uniref:Uncharacterized protein n=1 Tax=Anguilla anguilla TaxID=7936 RepID=A0A0E9VDV9_ANGAN
MFFTTMNLVKKIIIIKNTIKNKP